MKEPAPIALFVYNRPEHTKLTVESLARNPEARDSSLHVFSDGPQSEREVDAVRKVRSYLSQIKGFKVVSVVESKTNRGLSHSVIDGVDRVLRESDRVIVLEDDLVVSEHFLKFMNQGLAKFSDDPRVVSVHGYVYPTKRKLPDYFFLRGADCWGWATWRRGWELFEPDAAKLAAEISKKGLARAFDYNGSHGFLKMLEDQEKGIIDSWAIRWHASAFIHGKLTLYPGKSLVLNIGNDGSGTHTSPTDNFDGALATAPISLDEAVVQESGEARKEFERFFRSLGVRKRLKGFLLKVGGWACSNQ